MFSFLFVYWCLVFVGVCVCVGVCNVRYSRCFAKVFLFCRCLCLVLFV